MAPRALYSGPRRLRNLVEEATLADEVGPDVFGVGEHHRPDFAVSAPAVALAAVAARTERIRLTSAVSDRALRHRGRARGQARGGAPGSAAHGVPDRLAPRVGSARVASTDTSAPTSAITKTA